MFDFEAIVDCWKSRFANGGLLFCSSFLWGKAVLGRQVPLLGPTALYACLLLCTALSSPPIQIDPPPGKVSLGLLGLLGALFGAGGRLLTQTSSGREGSFGLGLHSGSPQLIQTTSASQACLTHFVLGLRKLSSAFPGLHDLLCFEPSPLSQPHPFPIHPLRLQLTALSLGGRNTSTARVTRAIPTPVINTGVPVFSTVNMRACLCSSVQNRAAPSSASRAALLPNSGRSPFCSCPQTSHFIAECKKKKRKEPSHHACRRLFQFRFSPKQNLR